jgi:hypothetical protein
MVVGEDSFYADAHLGDGQDGTFERPSSGGTALARQRLGISTAAVIVDRDMDVIVSSPAPPGTFAPAAGLREPCIEALAAPPGIRPRFSTSR